MRLRFVDDQEKGGVQVIFESPSLQKGFWVEDYDSPFSQGFKQRLSWYFEQFPGEKKDAEGGTDVVEKLVTRSRYLGDALLGEDHELIACTDIIEEIGYEHLDVCIESSRPEFFLEYWEYMVLPDSKYIVSTVARSFSRVFEDSAKVDIDYGLNVVTERQKNLSAMVNPNQSPAVEKNNPLRVLFLYPTENSANTNACFSLLDNSLTYDGAVVFECLPASNFKAVCTRLGDRSNPIHSVHYCGALAYTQDTLCMDGGIGESLMFPLSELVKKMIENSVAMLALDVTAYRRGGDNLSHQEGLALAAQEVQLQGLSNVVGLNHPTVSSISNACFTALYDKIASGLSLAQAVIEARKALQAESPREVVGARALQLHTWPLLVHYGSQSVSFFGKPQAKVNLEESSVLQHCQSHLLGFRSHLLPPQHFHIADTQVRGLLASMENHAQEHGPIRLSGPAGVGKTQTAHSLAFYAVLTGKVQRAYFFDFEQSAYSRADIWQMLAPILDVSPEQVPQALERERACFVFDGLGSQHWHQMAHEMCELHRELVHAGHTVIVCGQGEYLFRGSVSHVTVQPLTEFDSRRLAGRVLSQAKLMEKAQESHWRDSCEALLDSLQGHPFLIQKCLPLLDLQTPEALFASLQEKLDLSSQDTLVLAFYQWQWSLLPDLWKAIILLASQTEPLWLELLMIAWPSEHTSSSDTKAQDMDLQGQLSSMEGLTIDAEVPMVFSEVIQSLRRSGLLLASGNGHRVDNYFLSKLKVIEPEAFERAYLTDPAIALTVSRLIAEGLLRVGRHLLTKQDPLMLHYLVANRGAWVSHFERLWLAEDYTRFFSLMDVFEQLLGQVKLSGELAQWRMELALKSQPEKHTPGKNIAVELAWLTLAASSLSGTIEAPSQIKQQFQCAVDIWQNWLEHYDTVLQAQAALFSKAAAFVEAYYCATGQWLQVVDVCQKQLAVYKHFEAWLNVVKVLKLLSVAHTKLDQYAQATQCEQELIQGIDYSEAPEGVQAQILLDVVMARLARKEYGAAQTALDNLKRLKPQQGADALTQSVQADIDFATGRYAKALPFYTRLWKQANEAQDSPRAEQLQQRIDTIRHALGEMDFSQILRTELTDDGELANFVAVAGNAPTMH